MKSCLSFPSGAMTRRDFLRLTAVSAGMAAAAGCAVNPVTGQKQFMLVGRDDEIALDKQSSPQQISADYGVVQDQRTNAYVNWVGKQLASVSHRPEMPYNFHVVNAVYLNAYAFPGGTICITRGLLVSMRNEAELAAVLGHEIGHVTARHAGQQISTSMITSILVAGAGLGVGAATGNQDLAPLAAGLGALGAGALLAKYSRDDERQADDLGMQYMVRRGYNPEGMVGLLNVLRNQDREEPNALEAMFASHPMSDERYDTAVRQVSTTYAAARSSPVHAERFMAETAAVQKDAKAIRIMQDAQTLAGKKQYDQAGSALRAALKEAPGDYAGLLMLAKVHMAQKNYKQAEGHAYEAQKAYPSEPQAWLVRGMANFAMDNYGQAYDLFDDYERKLPGNVNLIFLKGLCQERMRRIDPAAREYIRFLKAGGSGEQAQYAQARLRQWGYVQ